MATNNYENFYNTAERPEEATVASYEADERQVDEATQTASGRAVGLLESGAPWITSARTRGYQAGAARGLLDSTMAIGEAEKQAYDAVIPVATADAETYRAQQLANQNAVNQARSTNAGFQQETGLFNTGFKNEQFLREQDTANVMKVNTQQEGIQTRLNAQQNAAALQQIGLQNAGAMSVQQLRNSGALEQIGLQAASDKELQEIIDESQMERLTFSENAATERTMITEAGATGRQEASDAAAMERTQLSETGATERTNITEAGADRRQQETIASNESIAEADRLWNLNLQEMNLDHDEMVTFGNFLKDTGQQYMIQQTAISTSGKLGKNAKNAALIDLKNSYREDVQAMADLYEIDISWDDNSGLFVTS